MKRSALLFLLLAFLAQNALAQIDQILFEDDFSNNRNKWNIYFTFQASAMITPAGEYIFEHKRQHGAWSSTKKIPIDQSKNFIIDVTLSKKLGTNNHGYGLVWGSRDSRNHFVFLISGDGHFQVGKAHNGQFDQLIEWRESEYINKWNSTNQLVVKKTNDKYYFFINTHLVGETAFEPFYAQNIGFLINKNIRIGVDNLTVAIDESPVINTQIAEISEPVNTSDSRPVSDYPPDLVVENVKLIEPSGNQILEATEDGNLQFDIRNQGRGASAGIQVRLTPVTDDNHLFYSNTTRTAPLQAGAHLTLSMPVSATTAAEEATYRFKIEVLEDNGFDADPAFITFETSPLAKADLQIRQLAIDDNKDAEGEGDSYGNGNSIIEPGESVEITAFVQNFGRGNATGVTAQVLLDTDDQNITLPSENEAINLGMISSGNYKKLEFYFYTSRRYSETDIPLSVRLTTTNGQATTIPLQLKMGERTPNVVDIRLTGNNAPDSVAVNPVTEIVELSDVDSNIPASRHNGENTLVVIIGIEEYKYAPDVEFANRDAQVFMRYMQQLFAVPEPNIFFRTNSDATAGEFSKVFAENGWLARRILPEETDVIVYYAGHGAPDPASKDAFLIPYDIDPNYATTGYNLNEMYAALGRLEARSVTVFLDACFSGLSRSNQMLLAGTRTVIIKPKEAAEIPANMAVFSASSGEQYSSSYPETYHGLFTYYLLKGLRGEADNGDNQLTQEELFEYVFQRVKIKAGYLDREQTPTFEGRDKTRVILEY